MRRHLSIDQVDALWTVDAPDRLERIIASMRATGEWKGRPLVVLKYGEWYRALTGSHRHAAAKKLGWPTIPCFVGDGLKLESAGIEFQNIRTVCDAERIVMLKRAGLNDVADQIQIEINENKLERNADVKVKSANW